MMLLRKKPKLVNASPCERWTCLMQVAMVDPGQINYIQLLAWLGLSGGWRPRVMLDGACRDGFVAWVGF